MNGTSLLEDTTRMLREHGQYRRVAEATGLDYNWLAKIAQGAISDPGVNKIERLHRYLCAIAEPPEAA